MEEFSINLSNEALRASEVGGAVELLLQYHARRYQRLHTQRHTSVVKSAALSDCLHGLENRLKPAIVMTLISLVSRTSTRLSCESPPIHIFQ